MQCPKCKTEMEKGSLFFNGIYWRKLSEENFFVKLDKMFVKGNRVWAYRCPNCKKSNSHQTNQFNNLAMEQ